MRIDNFDSDSPAYAGYLLEVLTRTLPTEAVDDCILDLEEQVNKTRLRSSPFYTRIGFKFTSSITSTGLEINTPNKTKKRLFLNRLLQ